MPLVRKYIPAVVAPRPPETPRQPKTSVLYVEDDDLNFEVLELLLRDDFDVVRARDASEALTHLTHHTFEILLLDVQLANSTMNGLEIAQAVHAAYSGGVSGAPKGFGFRGKCPKIIMLTASNLIDDAMPAPGTAAVLRKPIDLSGLLRVMRPEAASRATRQPVYP